MFSPRQGYRKQEDNNSPYSHFTFDNKQTKDKQQTNNRPHINRSGGKRLLTTKIDWFNLLAVQAALRSLLQCRSLKASVLSRAAFFMVQLSQLYLTLGRP